MLKTDCELRTVEYFHLQMALELRRLELRDIQRPYPILRLEQYLECVSAVPVNRKPTRLMSQEKLFGSDLARHLDLFA